MLRKIALFITIAGFLGCVFGIALKASAQSPSAEYLCEMGVGFFKKGNYEAALTEFKKVLLFDPGNTTAKAYINVIFKKEKDTQVSQILQAFEPVQQPEEPQAPPAQISREEMMNSVLSGYSSSDIIRKERVRRPIEVAGVKITGEGQLSMGVSSGDALWKRANADLNEKNWRVLSEAAFNNRDNTYDTRVYDRVRVNLDSGNEAGFNVHGNITVDPWSFTGKAPKTTITSAYGDTADVQLKYWSNTGYTLNETIFTNRLGNSFSLPEVKVVDGNTAAFSSSGIFYPWPDTFSVPATKIIRQFQPLRELWIDYIADGAKVRVFPIAYQDQALTFDDPLVLSNNHIWWQESPWIDRWKEGNLNATSPIDFSKGKFDNSLSYMVRDSDGTRLTALRGASVDFSPIENLSIVSTLAAPKDLWQDYDNVDNAISASRLKYRLLDNLSLGGLFTYRMGLTENKRTDYRNYLGGVDIGFEPIEGIKLDVETAFSQADYDLSNDDYTTSAQGYAYYVSLMGAYPRRNIIDLKYGYNDVKPEEHEPNFLKYKFYAARMDDGFDPALSNYRETRDDTFWSRHIHFRKPMDYFYAGLNKPTMGWDDISSYRIGNGIDIGRSVLGVRLETSLFDQRIYNLLDVRNVHNVNKKFIENVARDELTYKINDKFTTKILGIYQRLPKTTKGKDPFIFDTDTGLFVNNTSIVDGMNPSLKTGSLGMEYAFLDWLSLSGVWERTNDYTLAYDNFPRGNLSGTSFSTATQLTTLSQNGKLYRVEDPFLYSQGLFPLPPYPFYNIWKTGLRINAMDNLQLYLDYTRNEFKSAGQIDDNVNHVGMELAYMPTKKFGFFFKYIYSRFNDLEQMLAGGDRKIYLGHHNFFSEIRYLPSSEDELILQYGESGIFPIATITFDPFGGGTATVDTRHIIRAYYRRKF